MAGSSVLKTYQANRMDQDLKALFSIISLHLFQVELHVLVDPEQHIHLLQAMRYNISLFII